MTALAWSHTGVQLAFGSAQGGVFIFSADGPVQVLPMDQGGAASLAWSSKGPLACAGWDGTVRVVEPNGRPCDVQPEPSDRRGPPAIAWDHDGARLAIGGYDGEVAVWCAGGFRKVLQPKDRAVRALAWSPKQRRFWRLHMMMESYGSGGIRTGVMVVCRRFAYKGPRLLGWHGLRAKTIWWRLVLTVL